VLGALADGVHVGVVGAQLVVDDDAAFDLQARADGDVGVRPDAGCDHQQVAVQPPTVLEQHSLDVLGAEHLGGQDLEVHGDAELLDALLEDGPGLGVELGVHQPRRGVHELDLQAVALQGARGLQAEQAAAHDHGPPAAAGGLEHGAGLVDGPEPEDAGQQVAVLAPHALHRRDERVAAGGQHQVVVGGHRAVGAVHLLGRGVDPLGPDAGPQDHAVVGVPVVAVEDDVVLVRLPGQHRREHDPVVVAVRLVAEDGDPELFATAALEHLLDQAGAGHAVAHDDQRGALVELVGVEVQGRQAGRPATEDGGHQTSTSPRSTTSSPATPIGAAACSSTTQPPGRSSTTRSGTCTSPLAPIGNQRIGSPSRTSRT
jgi:hypothetical protein